MTTATPPRAATAPTARRWPRGVLTCACGQPLYIKMAKMLARSLRLHNPELPCALITDSTDPQLFRLFDAVIPLRPEFGPPLRQKLCFNQYTLFDETLYLDSDCLVVGDLSELFNIYSRVPYAVIGEQITSGNWYTDIPTLLKRLNVPSLPKFNSGLAYFRFGPASDAVFATALDILDRHDDFGIPTTHGPKSDQCSDEPALAAALALHGIPAIADNGRGQGVTWDPSIKISIDVLAGKCCYEYPSGFQYPLVAHFLAWTFLGPIYRRECLKLQFARFLPRPLASPLAAALYHISHWARNRASAVKKSLGFPRAPANG